MEINGGDKSNGNRKRKRGSLKRKLLVNEKVEVMQCCMILFFFFFLDKDSIFFLMNLRVVDFVLGFVI
jgi:hypothetical protein